MRVRAVVVVAILGRAVEQPLAQPLVALIVGLQGGDQLVPGERAVLIDQLLDRRQAVGRVAHLGQDRAIDAVARAGGRGLGQAVLDGGRKKGKGDRVLARPVPRAYRRSAGP